MAGSDENGKCDGESEAHNPVQSGSESEPADGGKQSFPRQGVMIQPTRCSTELNRQSDTGGNAGSQAKEETEAKAVADAEDNGVRYRSGKQAQRAVLSTQQVVGQIETTHHIKTGTRNADDRDGMVIHPTIVSLKFWRSCPDDGEY